MSELTSAEVHAVNQTVDRELKWAENNIHGQTMPKRDPDGEGLFGRDGRNCCQTDPLTNQHRAAFLFGQEIRSSNMTAE